MWYATRIFKTLLAFRFLLENYFVLQKLLIILQYNTPIPTLWLKGPLVSTKRTDRSINQLILMKVDTVNIWNFPQKSKYPVKKLSHCKISLTEAVWRFFLPHSKLLLLHLHYISTAVEAKGGCLEWNRREEGAEESWPYTYLSSFYSSVSHLIICCHACWEC